MKTFIYFTTRRFGVHLISCNMIEECAYIHIIGKIIEENYKLLIMIQYHANFGSLKIIFLNMEKVVKIN